MVFVECCCYSIKQNAHKLAFGFVLQILFSGLTYKNLLYTLYFVILD